MTPPPDDVRYRLNPAVRLYWAQWKSEHVAFDETSGQTHLMEPLRALIVDLLGEGSQSFDGIVNTIQAGVTQGDAPLPEDLVISILEELQVAGLVEALKA